MERTPIRVLSESRALVTPSVRAEGLHKRFGACPAVRGIDLELAPGEAVVLLGPNGAGKTTTLRMLAGVLRPDSGTVRIAGLDPWSRRGRAAIGVAPQELAIYPELTVLENLAFFGRLHRLGGRALRSRITDALELAGLAERRDRRAESLSGGMQRRLNLACALVHGPKILLLDEPTAGLDRQSTRHLFRSLGALRKRGTSIVCSTHHLEEAEQLCDRAVIVDRGRVVAEGPVAQFARRGIESVYLSLTGERAEERP